MPTFRSTCPRHCYGSCGMISHINGKKLTRVLGDPEHGYTRGRLCPKGYALIQYALDQQRLKYPMRQVRRGSGDWRRISWQEAYECIAAKILELYDRYGSNLASGYVKGSGNLGLLHQATEAMFAGLGPHTRPTGDICAATAEAALRETVGEPISPDPEDMAKAGLIVLWGANPAVTNINQMKFIYEARSNGGCLAVIDPILTKSAERSDLYIQINPGTDAWLAWGMAKMLLTNDQVDRTFIEQRTTGFEQFEQELRKINMDEVCLRTGVRLEAIEELAALYAGFSPIVNHLGFGLQRNEYGGHSVKAISALAALTGSFGPRGGGLYFRNNHLNDFPGNLISYEGTKHPLGLSSRSVSAGDYARKALELSDPPLKMLWVSCGNPLSQDHNLRAWNLLLQQMELIVTVDLYLTQTASQSDLVLPAASFFEEEDLHLSFWHHWLSLNQKVLPAFFEAKSDLQIARELTKALNSLRPGFSDFPAEKTPEDWIEQELSPRVRELYGLDNIWDLAQKPYKRKKEPLSALWKYRFSPPQPDAFSKVDAGKESYPYRLLTPQSLLKFHTQYETLDWLNSTEEPVIELAENIARRHKINDKHLIETFNNNGFIRGRAKINAALPDNIIVMEQSGRCSVNALIGSAQEVSGSIPYYDCTVNVRGAREYV